MAVGTIVINLIARTQAFEREMRRSRKTMTNFQRTTTATRKAVMFYAKSFLVTGGAIYALKAFVSEASKAEETLNKFNVVFRQQADAVSRWAETFGDSVGRSTHDVQQWLAGLQDTFVPLGIARDKAAELAKSLVTLAVDVASFNNAADPTVIRDFTSALVGNHETVRKYGIIISEAAMTQEALRQGLQKTFRQLSDLEKVQIRYALIQKGTTDAQGDAIRSADSYANQVKRLNANWDELKVTLGNRVIPMLSNLLVEMNKLIEAGGKFENAMVSILRTTGAPEDFIHRVGGALFDTGTGDELKPLNTPASLKHAAEVARRRNEAMTKAAQAPANMPGTDGGTMTPPGAPPMRRYQRYLEQLQHDMDNSTEYIKDQWAELAMDSERSLGNMFGNMIQDGKNWRDHMAGFFNDIGRAASQMAGQTAARAIFGSILGGGVQATVAHQGGIVGQMSASRRVSGAAFLGAPRLHGGLRSDEVPTILQKGEQVIPKGENGGGSTINFNVSAIDGPSVDRFLQQHRKRIANMMSQTGRENHTFGRGQE